MSADGIGDIDEDRVLAIHNGLVHLDAAREALDRHEVDRAHEATQRAEAALSEVVADE